MTTYRLNLTAKKAEYIPPEYTKKPKFKRIKDAVDKFEKLQIQYGTDYGASDSEPNNNFADLMEKAVLGESWPDPTPESWQLFSAEKGWQSVARKLTSEAKKVFNLIQKVATPEIIEHLQSYYGWVR